MALAAGRENNPRLAPCGSPDTEINTDGGEPKFQGRYFRLTDVHGRVVNEILA